MLLAMSTPAAVSGRAGHEAKGAIAVDPAIGAVIRNPAAPEGVPARVRPPPSLPGEVGLMALARSLYGYTRHGAGHAEAVRERHGDVYRYMWAAEPIVQVWDADEVQRMLRNEDSAWSTAMGWDTVVFDRLDTRKGNLGSLLSLDFDQHRVARKLLMPAFTSKAIKGYIDIAQPRFASAVDAWLARGQVDFKRAARGLLAHVASDIFTGCDDPREVMRLEQALEDFWRGPLALSKDPRLSPAFRRAQRGFKTLHDTFLALIPERRAQPGADLFSHLCQVEDRGGLDDDAMVRVFVTVMLGAFDTTSLGITSMAYLLARYPEWQERLRAEARSIDGAVLDNASLIKLEQHEWVWKETLRLMPLSLGVPRRALREVTVSGHKLAAGTMVVPMSGAMGRHPKWWSEPLKFDPLRFSPARAEDKRHPAIYLPFGAGAHACIGAQLANIEVKLLFRELLTRCRLELAPHYEARHTLTPLGCVSGKVRLKLMAP
jgi:cytochrome P450